MASIKALQQLAVDLPTIVGSNLKFMAAWSKKNEKVFMTVMDRVAETNPAKFADLFIRIQHELAVQSRIPNKITVEHTIEDDITKLRNSVTQQNAQFDTYEEVKSN